MPKKTSTIDHEILERINSILPAYIEGIDPSTTPTDPDEFLDWWWNNYAKACVECPLHTTRNKVVKPDGKASAKIMIVGEGPGFLEDLTGVPLVGSMELRGSHCSTCTNITSCYSSRILKDVYSRMGSPKIVKCTPNYTVNKVINYPFVLKSAGSVMDGILLTKYKFLYPRHNWLVEYNKNNPANALTVDSPWFITNSTLCRTTDISGLRDANPASLPREKCKKWLTFQWAAVNPEVMLVLGKVALATVLGSNKAAEKVKPNSVLDTKFGKVIFQNHPAYFMRERNKEIKAYGYAKIASSLDLALEIAGLK